MEKPNIVEKFTDNGEHSHWQLLDAETGVLLWSGDEVLPQSDVIKSLPCRNCDCGEPFKHSRCDCSCHD